MSRLHLKVSGGDLSGTYDVTASGRPVAIRYNITGTAKDGRLVTDWVIGSQALHVTGHYTATKIVLDNPGGKFSTTEFTATNC